MENLWSWYRVLARTDDGATKLRLTLHTYYNGMGSIRITDGGRLVSVKVGLSPEGKIP